MRYRGEVPWGSSEGIGPTFALIELLHHRYAEWHSRALCGEERRGKRGTPSYDLEWFFAERSSDARHNVQPTADEARAKAVCARCPVRRECTEAGWLEEWGVWGGAIPGERRRAWHRPDCAPGTKGAPRDHKICVPKREGVERLLEEMTAQARALGLIGQEEEVPT